MIESNYYSTDFYKEQVDTSYQSAKKIIPLVFELFKPKSVIDVGCGVGNWLKVWVDDFGILDYMGVEGPYVNPDMLMVPKENVLFADLKKPININRRFDIVMSMEVAEHIDGAFADLFVNNLIKLSDIVIFSAAIPNQEGTYHINEQNPEYWAKLFINKGYVTVDYFRKKIWNDKEINYWYRQNILLFIKKEKLSFFPDLLPCADATDPEFLLRIHPEMVAGKMDRLKQMESISGYIKLKLYQMKIGLRKMIK